jgi:CBS-domain-containing membrane protein
MRASTKPLFELTAADLMSRDPITIPQQMSLQGAAHRLARAEVSGAPVVDEFGRCVGVLSTTDLVRYLDRGEGAARRRACDCYQVYSPWQMIEVEKLPADEVKQYMTTDLVTASAQTRLGDLARSMLDAHIHRVIVLDAERRPVGVVTSTDLLGALAGCEAHAARAGRG